MVLTFAFNYGSRAEIIEATKALANEVKSGEISVEDINDEVFASKLQTSFLENLQDPDLMIQYKWRSAFK